MSTGQALGHLNVKTKAFEKIDYPLAIAVGSIGIIAENRTRYKYFFAHHEVNSMIAITFYIPAYEKFEHCYLLVVQKLNRTVA